MRKIYILPNLVTTANMAAGFYSIVASIHGRFLVAAWAIIVAAVFDMLDGRIARLAKATSQFGVEYDSLSDLISFGMAPAILMYQWMLEPYDRLGWLAAFLYVTCGALRLARFNVATQSDLSKKFFQGMPSPAAAGMIATFAMFHHETGWPAQPRGWALGFVLGLASLMISTVKFLSFKEFNWRSKASISYLPIFVLLMILIASKPEVSLFLLGVVYMLISLVTCLYRTIVPKAATESFPKSLS